MTTEQMEALADSGYFREQNYKNIIRKLIAKLEYQNSDYRGDKWVECRVCKSTRTDEKTKHIIHYADCAVVEAKRLIGDA